MKSHHVTAPILIGLVALTSGCGEEPVEQAPVVRPVKIMTISEGGAGSTRDLPGTIKAAQHADMAFEVSGKITEFLVKEGQAVRKGDVLTRLDDRDFQANLNGVEASYRKADADLKRSQQIYKEDPGAISTSKIDADRKAVEVVDAELIKARKAVEDTIMRAPFDGIMARRLVEDFQNVVAKEPVLVLQDNSSLEIEVSVPERDMVKGDGKRTNEEITERVQPRVEITSLPGRSFPAKVKEFATAADPATRTFQVRLTFEAPEDTQILPGMTARVVYNARGDAATIRLPTNATFADAEGNPHVWLVDSATMKVQRHPVKLGGLSGDTVEVLDGLTAGVEVAISGVSQLQDGVQVRRHQ